MRAETPYARFERTKRELEEMQRPYWQRVWRRSDTTPIVMSVLTGVAILVAFYMGISWLAGRVAADPEAQRIAANLTPWQWIAIVGIAVVAMKDMGTSETKEIAKALDKIAEEMRKTRERNDLRS